MRRSNDVLLGRLEVLLLAIGDRKFLDCPIRLDGGLVLRLGGFTFGRNQQKRQGREVGAEHVDVLLVTLPNRCTS